METREVKVLHIEDEFLQQQVIARFLRGLADYRFAIDYAPSEDEALRRFTDSRHELVLLDYHLTQGNGLNCLRRIRALDAVVPIIAISAAKTAGVAAELVSAGADDFLSKLDLSQKTLCQSLQAAFHRADGVRRLNSRARETNHAEAIWLDLARLWLHEISPEMVAGFDSLERQLRGSGLDAARLESLFDKVCHQLEADGAFPGVPVRPTLRPQFLDLLVRLYGPKALEKATGNVSGTGPTLSRYPE